jgi:hypothetical protein
VRPHSDFRTTRRYVHLAGEMFRDEAERMGRALWGDSGTKKAGTENPNRRRGWKRKKPFSCYFRLQGRQDSNLQPPVLETAAEWLDRAVSGCCVPAFVPGRTCASESVD